MTYSKVVSGDQSRNFVYENIQLAVDTQLVGKRQNLVKQFEQEKKVSKNTITLKYDPTHEVDRVLNGKKKDFYPKYLNEGKWETGLGDRKTWKPYGCETILNFHGEFPLWHEGEKATAYAINKGLPSISVVGSGAEDETIIRNAIRILQAMESGGAIYIIDNDEAAIRKARAIQKIAKKEDFLVLALPIKAIFPKAEKGDDIVEYLKANPNHTTTDIKNDIEVVIEEYFDSLIKDYENCDKEAEKPINQGKVVKFPRQIDTKTALGVCRT
jgi:hypothetical protein